MARIHHQGVQQSLLHQTTATPPTECTERTEPSCRERTPTDGTDEHRWLWCAVLPQNSQNTQNWAAWVWQGCHTLLICEHPCSSVGGSSLPEGSVCSVRSAGISFLPQMVRMNTDGWGALFSHRIHRIHRIWQRGYGRDAIPSYICAHPCHLWESFLSKRFCEFRAFCGNIFSPTDFTDLHRCLGCALFPRNSQNPQNLAAWVWQGCHTLLHLCASVSSVGGSSLQGVLCIRCIPWELLHRLFCWCSSCSGKRQSRAETAAPPGVIHGSSAHISPPHLLTTTTPFHLKPSLLHVLPVLWV